MAVDETLESGRLTDNGFRLTPQRHLIYTQLIHRQDHPTANEVYERARHAMPGISMATVYNCLDALVQSGLVRVVTLDRSAARYCPNMAEHCHFRCDRCGGIYDVDFSLDAARSKIPMPSGFAINDFDIVLRGICGECEEQAKKDNKTESVRSRYPSSEGAPVRVPIRQVLAEQMKSKPESDEILVSEDRGTAD